MSNPRVINPRDEDWLALALRSESNQPNEWRYIAAVILNRLGSVEFPNNIVEVIRQPLQFSFFNATRYLGRRAAWEEIMAENSYPWLMSDSLLELSVATARAALMKPLSEREFGLRVRNYWSPRSMVPTGAMPKWDYSRLRVFAVDAIDPWRFMFAELVDPSHPLAGNCRATLERLGIEPPGDPVEFTA